MPFVVFVLLAIGLLILVSGGYTFLAACVRRKELPWDVEEELKKTHYGRYYDNICLGKKFLEAHNAKDVYIQSFDGLKLHALWIPAQNPKGTILFAHGYRSNKLVDFSLAFSFYHDYGMNILVPDQRSHGKSEGKYITFGVKESRDMESWIAYHNETYGAYSMVLSGLSMGASTMLYLADQVLPQNVKGIIADCGFVSPWEILGCVFRRVIHLPAAPSLWVTEWFARVFAGFSLREKDTRIVLKNAKLPVLLVHGVDDGFVPCAMTEQGYSACIGPKELLLVEGADHGLSFLVDRQRYEEKIRNFLKNYVEEVQ